MLIALLLLAQSGENGGAFVHSRLQISDLFSHRFEKRRFPFSHGTKMEVLHMFQMMGRTRNER